jgi:hypothetical protein
MKAADNVFLKLRPGVVLTPVIEPVICALEVYFREANLKAFVTSGLRDAHDQLRIVKRYLVVKGLAQLYPAAMACKHPLEKEGKHYVWQLAWSHLLNAGVIINPPLAAECLMDYMRNGKNRKGTIINQTPHANGVCFDIGGAGGEDATIKDELTVMQRAMKAGVKGLINILPEHNNNAIHCDCVRI